MKTVRTICVKLSPTPEQVSAFDATLHAFADGCNLVYDTCKNLKTSSKYDVHKAIYQTVRKQCGLSANLAVRAIARACAAYKLVDNAVFSPTSVDYDQRIFSFVERDSVFSLTTLSGRVRVKAILGEFQRTALAGQKPTSATLVKRKFGYYLHVQVKSDSPEEISVSDVVGIDFGIANIATDSDGNRFCGKPVERIRRKHNLQRKRLQRRNTKGAKKKLKRVSGKEAKFRRHVNHVISKFFVETAKRTGRAIALEDLEGIRERVTARWSEAKNRLSSWAFYQLRTFIEYKAKIAGVPMIVVNPANTSRMCSKCGHCESANRPSQAKFGCLACGFESHADENAARNIRALGKRNLPTELAN